MSDKMIPMEGQELEDLMMLLEKETGIPSATVSVPVVASSEEVIDEGDISEKELAEALGASDPTPPVPPVNDMFTDEELAEESLLTAEALKADDVKKANNLQSGLAALKGKTTAPESDSESDAILASLQDEPVSLKAEVPEPEIKTMELRVPASPPVGVFSAPLRFVVDPGSFKKETAVNPNDLDTCFVQQSSLRAFYNTQSAEAESQAARIKLRFDIIEAKLYDKHRRELTATVAKPTEKMVENAVKCDPLWLQAKERVIDAETIANINKGLSMSLADRRDMLIQLGANQRDESKGQLRMQAVREANESMTDRALAAGSSALK